MGGEGGEGRGEEEGERKEGGKDRRLEAPQASTRVFPMKRHGEPLLEQNGAGAVCRELA